MGGETVSTNARRQPAVMRQIRTLFGVGTASGLSDGELLGRLAARADESSELAFAALLERHGGMVWGICRRVLDDPRDVEDAFQATFLVLVRRARSIRNRESLASWLHGVAYRVACSAREAGIRRRRHERIYSERAERLAPPACEEDLDLKPVVDGELLRLPERYRAVLVLCDMEGLSYEQAARALGWPMGTVKSRLARGREKLRSRLIRRGVAPLAGMIAAQVPAELLRSTAQAASRVGARPIVAGAISVNIVGLTEGVISTMMLSKLKLCVAALAVGGGLVSLAGLLTGPGFGVKAGTHEPRPPQAAEFWKAQVPEAVLKAAEPPLLESTLESPPGRAIPKPWETVVRVRVQCQDLVNFGSGTIIRSTPEESLIVTCAALFRVEDPHPLPPGKSPWKVTVDLFDGKLRQDRPNQVTFAATIGGEIVDFDFSHNVGLVRIRPGRRLAATPIVPAGWQARLGMKMLTAGCSEGQDATAWNTKVTGGVTQYLRGEASYDEIECETAPKEGRTGGGLFTTEGYLAGVCGLADPRRDLGLYAPPRAIHSILDRNDLSQLHVNESNLADPASQVLTDEKPIGNDSSPPGADDLKARLEESTRQNARLGDEVRQLRDELRSLRDGGRNARPDAAPDQSVRSAPPSTTPPSASARPPRNATASAAAPANRPDAGEPGTEGEGQGHRRIGGFIFAASPTGSRVIAYDPVTRWTADLLLNATKENPLKVRFSASPDSPGRQAPVALHISGAQIRRIAAFDLKSRTWHAHDLAEPVSGQAIPYPSGDGSIAYDLGRHLYTFNPKSLAWDHLDVSAISDVAGEASKGSAIPISPDRR
jgi:RNA polymerase sigma factor (sigma-70 family)